MAMLSKLEMYTCYDESDSSGSSIPSGSKIVSGYYIASGSQRSGKVVGVLKSTFGMKEGLGIFRGVIE